MGPTCFGVMFFVGLAVVVLLLLLLLLCIFAVPQTRGDPNLYVFLVCRELCNRWEGFGVGCVWWFSVNFVFLSLEPH